MKIEVTGDVHFAKRIFGLVTASLPLCDDLLQFRTRVKGMIVRQIEFNETYVDWLSSNRTVFVGEALNFTAFRENGNYILVVTSRPCRLREAIQYRNAIRNLNANQNKDECPKNWIYKLFSWISVSLKLKKD